MMTCSALPPPKSAAPAQARAGGARRLGALLGAPALLALAAGLAPAPVMATQAQRPQASAKAARNVSEDRDSRARATQAPPAVRGLGDALPQGFTARMLQDALAPGTNAKALLLAGARPWQQRENSYVAIVCLAHSEAAADARRRASSVAGCESSDANEPIEVFFGVFERDSDGLRLVARTPQAIDVAVDWRNQAMDMPETLDVDLTAGATGAGMPQNWQRFDLAPYRLEPGEPAFGVRAGWSDLYGGGYATFEALYLLRIEDDRLRVIFAQPMSFIKVLAGDWNADGTRDHETTQADRTVRVLASSTEEMRDIAVRTRGEKGDDVFKWSPAHHRYEH